jgi:uncharacterized Zn finger protein
MPTVAALIEAELSQTTESVRSRGAELERAGAVQLVRFAPFLITAEVDDAAAHVEFTIVEGCLQWFCTCPAGRTGVFCHHCVATTLATRRHTPDASLP